MRNLETEIANYSIKNNGKKYNGQPTDKGYYELTSFENSEIDTTVKGDKPNSIKVCLSSLGQVEKAMFEYGKYYVSYDGKKGSISDKDTYDNFSCSGNIAGGNETLTEVAGLYDSNNNLLYTWDELVNNYGIDIERDYGTDSEGLTADEEELPGYILATNADLKNGTKLVIDSSITKIGIYGLGGTDGYDGKSKLVEIVIPDTVVSIGSMGLGYNPDLTKVRLPKNLTIIPNYLFMGNESLKEIEIPDSVVSIGMSAFAYCAVEDLIIPEKVINIADFAVINCANLTSVTIPKSVTTIGRYAFGYNEKLTTINYTGTEAKWNTITFGEGWSESSPINKINYDYKIN